MTLGVSMAVRIDERLQEFLRSHYYSEILRLSREGKPYVSVDFSLLDMFDPMIADQLLEEPDKVLKEFQSAIANIDLPEYAKIRVRVRNLPARNAIRIRELRSKHIGRFMMIDGIVKSASEVKPQIVKSIFKCPDCGTLIEVEQDDRLMRYPNFCTCGRRVGFELVENEMIDFRVITLNDPFGTATGEKPGEIRVLLQEDLTTPSMQRKTDPGARLKITGILREQKRTVKGKTITKMDMYLDANHVEPSDTEFEELDISEEDERKIKELASDPNVYEKLRDSMAPTIFGHEEVKEAIIMQIFGGLPHVSPDSTRVRGNIHILITGDPSVGKTQLLKLVSDIMPRGKYVSGTGATGAGLTASVRKDEELGTWMLEAGALIMANKGVISIDEFDKMSNEDQIAMHEAMSVETVSIAKASITATLPAQTAVLAGANPKFGRFDPMRSVVEQINIPETLMSRFDLKFALRDRPDRAMDEKMTEHVLRSRTEPYTMAPIVPINLLRKYIAYVRKNITEVELSPEAAALMNNFYVDMRNKYEYTSEENVPVAITFRQFEALLRLSEASARIRLGNKVTVADAERAIKLMRFSLSQLGQDPETGRIDIDRLESGVTASQRNKYRAVLDIIDQLGKRGEAVAIEDVKAESEAQGLSGVDDIIEKLKHDGSVFEPRSGFIRKL